ncbi:MAG: rane protein [Herbaspirillum sp.]|nr:rane protein [Herbaspirillum sp.]
MSNHAIQASQDAQYMVQHPAKWTLSKAGIKNLLTALHYLVTVVGIAALTVLGAMFFNPSFADRVMAHSPFSTAEAAPVPAPQKPVALPPLSNLMLPPAQAADIVPAAMPASALSADDRRMIGTQRQQKLVTNWLAKRYHVAGDAANMLVSAAYINAKDIKLDPLLILAVMAIESSFNPFAESPVGAQGLMQVMSKIHQEKFDDLGGIKAALNPAANIKVGSLILKEYVTRGGSIEAGLKTYVGAAGYESDGGYGAKVMSEYYRLKEVAAGKSVSPFAITAAAKQIAPKQVVYAPPATASTANTGASEKMVSL